MRFLTFFQKLPNILSAFIRYGIKAVYPALIGAENLICAVKSGNDFINLLDGKVIEISNGKITKKQPDLGLAFYASKNFVL